MIKSVWALLADVFLVNCHISHPWKLYFRRKLSGMKFADNDQECLGKLADTFFCDILVTFLNIADNDQEWVGFRAKQTLWRPFEGALKVRLF